MEYLTAIVPSLGVLFLFVLAIRAIFQADRRERLAQAQLERQDRATAATDLAGDGIDPGTTGPR